MRTLPLIFMIFIARAANAECFDPALEAGFGYKDSVTQSLVITQRLPPSRTQKVGDTVVGIGVKGLYYGCKIPQASIAPKTAGAKKFNLFLPLRGATVQGFELDISTESRRVLAGRPIQVPWTVVDRNLGVTAACLPSTPSAFEGFLYGALRNARARRCTIPEIEVLVGQSLVPVRPNGATTYMKTAPVPDAATPKTPAPKRK